MSLLVFLKEMTLLFIRPLQSQLLSIKCISEKINIILVCIVYNNKTTSACINVFAYQGNRGMRVLGVNFLSQITDGQ